MTFDFAGTSDDAVRNLLAIVIAAKEEEKAAAMGALVHYVHSELVVPSVGRQLRGRGNADVEDVIQGSMHNLYEWLVRQSTIPDRLLGTIHLIINRRVLDYVRNQYRPQQQTVSLTTAAGNLSDSLADPKTVEPHALAEAAEATKAIDRFAAKLSWLQREVLYAKLSGATETAIAEMLGLTKGMVTHHVRSLRKFYNKHAEELGLPSVL